MEYLRDAGADTKPRMRESYTHVVQGSVKIELFQAAVPPPRTRDLRRTRAGLAITTSRLR